MFPDKETPEDDEEVWWNQAIKETPLDQAFTGRFHDWLDWYFPKVGDPEAPKHVYTKFTFDFFPRWLPKQLKESELGKQAKIEFPELVLWGRRIPIAFFTIGVIVGILILITAIGGVASLFH